MVRRLASILVLGAALAVCQTMAARAEIVPFSDKDAMTGTTDTGIEIMSDDQQAAMLFYCESRPGFRGPVITFSHGKFITSGGRGFGFAYRVDGGRMQQAVFRANPNEKSGQFRPTMGWERPGVAPYSVASPMSKIRAWERHADEAFFGDFAAGKSALVRASDFRGLPSTYRFDLTGLAARITPALRQCFSE